MAGHENHSLANAIAKRNPEELAEHAAPAPMQIDPQAAELINAMFEQLKNIFPAWRHAFPTQDSLDRARKTWVKAMIENKITSREQLQLGLKVARAQEIPFFPSPGQFLTWCEPTPEQFGLPDADTAYREAIGKRPSHPAVTVAANSTSWERRTLAEPKYRAVFDRAYAVAVRRVMAGEDLADEIPKALPKRKDVSVSPEERMRIGLEGVAKLKALFNKTHGGEK